MVEQIAEKDRFRWRLLCYGAIGSLVSFLPIAAQDYDVGGLVCCVIVILVSIVLILVAIFAKGRKRLSVLSMLVAYWAVSGVLFKNAYDLRASIRWIRGARAYKADTLARPAPDNGELKHIEWDGWGFAGSDTVVYLVFNPDDSLSSAAKDHLSGRYKGIPCEVPQVHRLESQWYSVVFYTNTAWDQCD